MRKPADSSTDSTARVVGGVALLAILGILLAVSLFVGLMLATAGGAVYPPLYRAGAALACDGTFEIESQRYSYKPGQSGVQHTIHCRDAHGGARAEITLRAIGAAFLVYSGAAFALGLIPALLLARAIGKGVRRLPRWWQGMPKASAARVVVNGREVGSAGELPPEAREGLASAMALLDIGSAASAATSSTDAAERLRALRRLYDEGVIDRREYEAKKAELLKLL